MKQKDLLEVKKKIKNKKPSFYRQDAHKKAKLGYKWRKPKGLHSKMRDSKKGYRKSVKVGYRTPSLVRGHDSQGKVIRIVSNMAALSKIDPEKESVIISADVGTKKKIDMLTHIKTKNITILNIKDIDAFVKRFEEKQNLKKQAKSKKQEVTKSKTVKKQDLADKVQEETDNKKQEKIEKDKVLTKVQK